MNASEDLAFVADSPKSEHPNALPRRRASGRPASVSSAEATPEHQIFCDFCRTVTTERRRQTYKATVAVCSNALIGWRKCRFLRFTWRKKNLAGRPLRQPLPAILLASWRRAA